jgi:hypothetical protein
VPELPKNAAADYLRRSKRIQRKRRSWNWRRLAWLVPNAVWAIDGTWMDERVAGFSRRALVVVDLHRRRLLALEPVHGERKKAVVELLRRLFRRMRPGAVARSSAAVARFAGCRRPGFEGGDVCWICDTAFRPRNALRPAWAAMPSGTEIRRDRPSP